MPVAQPSTTLRLKPTSTPVEPAPVTEEPGRPTRQPVSTATGTLPPSAAGTQEQPATSATPTLVPASPTPPLFPTPTRVEAPTIMSFRANVEEAAPGQIITLTWSTTRAITVALWHLAPTGQFSRFWQVEASGRFEYPIGANERNSTSFTLAASDGRNPVEMATLSVRLRCPDEWFFANAPDICPAREPLVSPAAEQHFERGAMLWVADEDRIYVLFADGRRDWTAFQDQWGPSLPDRDPDLEPPPDRYQPVRGFGLAWREQPGLRDRLGWAIDEESPYQTSLQRTSYAKYNHTYILALDGEIWHLLAERSGWEKIPPG